MTWMPLYPSTPMRDGKEIALDDDSEQWSNDEYVVYKRTIKSDDPEMPDIVHLSIRNQDRGVRHDWRHFQRIKNQLCGPEWEAMEIYPAESRLVDGANQYHLWCFPFRIGIGFPERLVANPAQSHMASPGSVQRDFEPVDLQYGGLSKMKDIIADNPPDRLLEDQ